MGSKDIIEIEFLTRERSLLIKSDKYISYEEARNIIAEFMLNNLDFSDYPSKLSIAMNIKYSDNNLL